MNITIRYVRLSMLIAFFMLGGVGTVTVCAVVPQQINYQGSLTDRSGNPLTAMLPMVFRLYAVATGGCPYGRKSGLPQNTT